MSIVLPEPLLEDAARREKPEEFARRLQRNFDAISVEAQSDRLPAHAPAGTSNVYVQTTDPAATTPYVWFQVDGSGALVSLWVAA